MRRDCLVERVPQERLAREADVAVGVGDGAAQERDVDRLRGAVLQEFDAAELDNADRVIVIVVVAVVFAGGGSSSRSSPLAPLARVDKRPDADSGQRPRPARCAVAKHVRHCPEWQVHTFDRAGAEVWPELGAEADPSVGQFRQRRRHREPAEAAPFAVADGGDDDGAEVLGRARLVVAGAEGFDQGLREARADEAGDLVRGGEARAVRKSGKTKKKRVRVPSNEVFFFSTSHRRPQLNLSLSALPNPPLNFTVMVSPSRISATASAALSTRRGAERGAERGQASSSTDDADDDEVDSMGRRSSVRAPLSSARWERSTARRRALALAMMVQRERLFERG